jgi:dihydrofolate reductase
VLKNYNPDDVFVIGGAMFYKTMLPYCTEVYVTKVDADGGAEVFYENLDKLPNFTCEVLSDVINTNGYDIRFTVYKNSKALEF